MTGWFAFSFSAVKHAIAVAGYLYKKKKPSVQDKLSSSQANHYMTTLLLKPNTTLKRLFLKPIVPIQEMFSAVCG